MEPKKQMHKHKKTLIVNRYREQTGGCQKGGGRESDETHEGDQRYKLPATR